VFSLSGKGRGIIQIVAGIFMAIMAANMLGLFPALRKIMPRLPKNISEKIEGIKTKNANGAWRGPLVVGLLNGLMPCGPLQAMQLYTLSAGSAARGAAAMFAFALGTLPLMFALGAAGSFLASRPAIARRVMTAGAVVVAVMGISMFSQGWVLSGFSILPQGANALAEKPGNAESGNAAKVSGGIQILNTTLSPGKFPAVFVQAGIPVRWTIDAPEGSINGCNNKIVIPEYDIQYRFKPGENVIEFTPQSIGKFRYSCWMGMIRGSINVVADEAALAAAAGAPDPADAEPVPANYAIPTDSLAVAEPGDYKGNKIQRVRIRLTDEGFVPAVAVVEKGIPAEWVIVNESIEDGSAELRVPLYKTVIPLKKQAENPLYLMAGDDFDFATGDGIFFGYIKSVDDINNFDAEAVKKEAAAFETLIYSDEYYEEGANAGCCADNSSRR
jgi:sulfite exporter TauE/SafE/plastocyanin domain-containing protein